MADKAKLLVLYHSSYGHTETLAYAMAHGVRAVEDIRVTVKRVPELMPDDVMASAGMKVEQPAPIAEPGELAEYDGIIIGTPTRFGNMSSQMRYFLDQTGPLWAAGALIGKVGSVFTSTAFQHGGQETTLTSFHSILLHRGMLIVGMPYACRELLNMDEITGGPPMAPAPWPPPAASSRRTTSSPSPAIRASTWPGSRTG